MPYTQMALQGSLWAELQSSAQLSGRLLPMRSTGPASPPPSMPFLLPEPPGLEGFGNPTSVTSFRESLRAVAAATGTGMSAKKVKPTGTPAQGLPFSSLCATMSQAKLAEAQQLQQTHRRDGAPVSVGDNIPDMQLPSAMNFAASVQPQTYNYCNAAPTTVTQNSCQQPAPVPECPQPSAPPRHSVQPSASSGVTVQRKNNREGKGKAAITSDLSDAELLTKERVVQMAKTQAGSKCLQRKLLKGHPTVIQGILDGLEVELPSIMRDMYGNYLCSAAFQVCSVMQRQRMLQMTTRHLKEIATDRWGTHSLQALISFICTAEEQHLLMHSLKDNLVAIGCDANGVHSLQRSLLSFGQSFMDVILPEVVANLRTFAQNPHGLGFLKRCMSHCRDAISQQQLINALSVHALDLVQGPFGNYAVQHALEEWGGEACDKIIQALVEKVVQLSIQKFSSNVVEQMLKCATFCTQRRLLEELSNPQQICVLMSTVYGHFVARRVLQLARPEQKAVFERTLSHGLRQVRGKRLRLRWERVLQGVDEAIDILDAEADDAPIDAEDLHCEMSMPAN